MIVGNGLIAQALKSIDNESVVFIAAGVSNSKCNDVREFNREKNLVEKVLSNYPEKLIVFFSTYSILDKSLSKSAYVNHKLSLEKKISSSKNKYLIARVSNLVGQGGNPNNVFNFLYNSISKEQQFELWKDSSRNLLLVEDFVRILNFILEEEIKTSESKIFNIVNSQNIKIEEIVHAIEKHINVKAQYKVVDLTSNSGLVDEESKNRFVMLGIQSENYIEKIIKYFHLNRLPN
jgi:nucleoside-diphosphate-sugar epimerase